MQNRLVLVSLVLASATACRRSPDPETQRAMARIDALEKRIDTLEKHPATAAAAPARRPGPDPNTVYALPVDTDDNVRGATAAKVTIVEGFDFACPYCAQSTPAVQAAADAYKDQVRIVSKQFVVHPQVATTAALGACAAQKQGKGPDFEHAVWAAAWPMNGDKPSFNKDALSDDSLVKIAGTVGLDVGKWKTDRDSDACKQTISKDARELTTIGVNGTPAFFVNGKPYVGPRTADGFKQAIADAIKVADASGTPPAGYYDALMKNAKTAL